MNTQTTNNVTFGQTEQRDEPEQQTVDMSNYTLVDADHLDEDDVLPEQKYCLLSFMSPEGIMNCNVRAVKFRGAFATLEAAEKYAAKLESQDAYFKIFVGETGKWLDCDANSQKVEKEKTSNPQHQQIIDAQSKQRMAKINELAGRTKQLMDKKQKGRKDMMNEKKKEGAAQELVDKRRQRQTSNTQNTRNNNENKLGEMKERMRKKLEEKQNKKKLQNLGNTEDITNNIGTKIKVVAKNSVEVSDNKAKLEVVDKNIERIKELMTNRRNKE